MFRSTRVSRADLLELLSGAAAFDRPDLAELLGYEWIPQEKTVQSDPEKFQEIEGDEIPEYESDDGEDDSDEIIEEKPVGVDRKNGEIIFPVPVLARTFEKYQDPPDGYPPPLQIAELSRRGMSASLPYDSLFTRPRLYGYLRGVLTSESAGRKLDERKLVRNFAELRSMDKLPRKKQKAWVPKVTVITDTSDEMQPFEWDTSDIIDFLDDQFGTHALNAFSAHGANGREIFRNVSSGSHLLLLSCMGQMLEDSHVIQSWLSIGATLNQRGVTFCALVPCPQEYWNEDLADLWNMQCWDHGAKIRPGQKAVGLQSPDQKLDSCVEQILDWLSPAVLVDRGLLRSVRKSLGWQLGVASEWKFWFHPRVWRDTDTCGVEASRAIEGMGRLRNLNPTFKQDIGDTILSHHQSASPAVFHETALHLQDAGFSITHQLDSEIKDHLVGLRELLFNLAVQGNVEKDRNAISLALWFLQAFEAFPNSIRKENFVSEIYALAARLASDSADADVEGVNMDAVRAMIQRLGSQLPRQKFNLLWTNGKIHLKPSQPGSSSVELPSTSLPVAMMSSSTGDIEIISMNSGMDKDAPVETALRLEPIIPFSPQNSYQVTTNIQSLYLTHYPRPSWAKRMAYDRHGLYADLEVEGVEVKRVEFRLRWIPPGQFMMGDGNKKKQVTISRGFWMAATQTTQALWNVVDPHNKRTFRFDGTNRPAENVSYHDVLEFTAALNKKIPQLFFSLPTEAQWEYACRAGTESEFNGGPDVQLDELGWYDENSNSQTHDVALKQANAWGLYDMHGNVWEWCLDWYGDLESTPDIDPRGPERGWTRVLRGGSWIGNARNCRSADRDGLEPDHRARPGFPPCRRSRFGRRSRGLLGTRSDGGESLGQGLGAGSESGLGGIIRWGDCRLPH